MSAHTPNALHSTAALIAREDELELSSFRVMVTEGPDRGREVESDGVEVSIGAVAGNHLVLEDPTVSRHHAVIVCTGDGFLLRDLGSTNGTTLGGFRVKEAFLEPGAVIGVGRSKMVFDVPGKPIRQPLSRAGRFGDALGESAVMRRAFALLERLAPSDTTVLLLGETGTGKGLFAEALHARSPRKDAPFVVVDCGAIPPSLIESELFGHEKGSFTGAHERRIGQFEAAKGGTIFLDEIGELPLDLQPKLLRVLDKRVLRRVGSLEPVPVDVRIVAATNRDLRHEVNRGQFRADLFYRLNIASVTVPPLGERREDIPLLVAKFWSELAGPGQAPEPPAALLARFVRQDWPGNVRQLRNAVERAVLLGDPGNLAGDPAAAAAPVPRARAATSPIEAMGGFDEAQAFRAAKEVAVGRWERAYLAELVRRCRGNVSRAARTARMDRNHLRDLLKRYGLDGSSTDGNE